MFLASFLKMAKDSAARIELGRSLHQEGTVNEKVCENNFVPLWDGTIMRRLGMGISDHISFRVIHRFEKRVLD